MPYRFRPVQSPSISQRYTPCAPRCWSLSVKIWDLGVRLFFDVRLTRLYAAHQPGRSQSLLTVKRRPSTHKTNWSLCQCWWVKSFEQLARTHFVCMTVASKHGQQEEILFAERGKQQHVACGQPSCLDGTDVHTRDTYPECTVFSA